MGQNKFGRVLFLDCSDILPGYVVLSKIGQIETVLETPVNILGGVYVRYNAGEALSAELWKNRKGPWNRK